MHVPGTSFLALYLAHLVTDFVLQSNRMVVGKRRGSVLAYLEHGAIHFFAAVLFLGFGVHGLWRNSGFYGAVAALTLVHLGIDWSKIGLVRFGRVKDGAALFFGDQAAHFVSVTFAAWLVARPSVADLTTKIRWFQSNTEKPFLRWLCCPFSNQAIAEKRCGSHRGIHKSARKCRFIYWVARKICGPNISCSAVASHCRADSDGKIDCAVSGAEVDTFCGILPHRHAPQCDAGHSRWARVAKGVLRYGGAWKMMHLTVDRLVANHNVRGLCRTGRLTRFPRQNECLAGVRFG